MTTSTPEELRKPVAAICGQNPVLPADRVGCGKPIPTCAEVYRCTDCATPFHRECAVSHFGTHAAPGVEGRGDGYKIPDDPCRAMAKLFAKMDDEDKNTFNWLMAARASALTYTAPPTDALVEALDKALELLSVPEHAQDEMWQRKYYEVVEVHNRYVPKDGQTHAEPPAATDGFVRVPNGWPKATPGDAENGWTLSYRFLEEIKDRCRREQPSLETVEEVLLAAAPQSGKADYESWSKQNAHAEDVRTRIPGAAPPAVVRAPDDVIKRVQRRIQYVMAANAKHLPDAKVHLFVSDVEHLLACAASGKKEDVSALYHELLYAVARKWPGESRHQTALRYIKDCERYPSREPSPPASKAEGE